MNHLLNFEKHAREFLEEQKSFGDATHDLAHVQRVVRNAEFLAASMDADANIWVPSAWLHDCVYLSKKDDSVHRASTLSADKAILFLRSLSFPERYFQDIHHAIEAHSYSSDIKPQTTEAKLIQDADRLDALGAIGIARCFATGGSMGSSIYHPDDPFPQHREPNDMRYMVDHFYRKLLKLPPTFNTEPARLEAQRRVAIMEAFLDELSIELRTPIPKS